MPGMPSAASAPSQPPTEAEALRWWPDWRLCGNLGWGSRTPFRAKRVRRSGTPITPSALGLGRVAGIS